MSTRYSILNFWAKKRANLFKVKAQPKYPEPKATVPSVGFT